MRPGTYLQVQSIVVADFTDRTIWESFLNEGEKHKLCVWFNSLNFDESAVLRFQEIAEGSMIAEGSVIVSNVFGTNEKYNK